MNWSTFYPLSQMRRDSIDQNSSFPVELPILESGLERTGMGSVPNYGLMEPSTKANGSTIRHAGEGNLSTQTGMNTKESGWMTRPTDMEPIHIRMVLNTQATG